MIDLSISSVNVPLADYRTSVTLVEFLNTLATIKGTSANAELDRVLRAAYAREMPGLKMLSSLPRGAERQVLIALLHLPVSHDSQGVASFNEARAWLSPTALVNLLSMANNTVQIVLRRLLERQALHRVQKREPGTRGPAPYAYSLTGYGCKLVTDCVNESTDFEANPLPYQMAVEAVTLWERYLLRQGLPRWDHEAEAYEPAPTPPAFVPRLANGRRLDETCKAHGCDQIPIAGGYCDVHA